MITLKEWKRLDEEQKDWICIKQTLSLSFIEKIWKDLTGKQKETIYKRDPLIRFVMEGRKREGEKK